MTEHQFIEGTPITDAGAVTRDGYRAFSVRAGRTGIQAYRGSELGMPEHDTIRVYRPEAEVFAPDSMRTLAHRPVTNDHPTEPVTADNWREHSVGAVGDEITRDGQFLRVPMLLMDAGAIRDVDAGKRELSLGYTATLTMQDGESPEGEPYTAVMTNLAHNHLAIVQRGRAGPDVRIGDSQPKTWGATPITDSDPADVADTSTAAPAVNHEHKAMSTRTIVVDGLSVETTDAGAQAIEKLQKDVKSAQDATAEAKAEAATAAEAAKKVADEALEEANKALATKDAEISDLKGKVLDDAAIDARVAEKAAVVAKARSFAKDADFAGKSDVEIKAIAVDAHYGEGTSKDKPAAYIDTAFELLEVADKDNVDPVAAALKDRDTTNQDTADNGYTAMKDSLSNAWKAGSKEAA